MPKVSGRWVTETQPAARIGESGRIGEREHRLGKVRVGGAPGEDPPDPRQDALEVEPVQDAEDRPRRRGEFEDDHAPAGPDGAAHLAKGALAVDDVPDPEGDAGGVEDPVPEGEALPGPPKERDAPGSPRTRALLPPHPHHLHGKVDTHDGCARAFPAQYLQRHVGRPGRYVQEPSAGQRDGFRDGETAPAPVHPQRQQPVEEIVPGSDGGEHLPDRPVAVGESIQFAKLRRDFRVSSIAGSMYRQIRAERMNIRPASARLRGMRKGRYAP
jgi:hypothetical protein